MTILTLFRPVGLCLMLMVGSIVATPVAAQEWTRFRGPNGSGQSDANIPAQWSDKDFNWKIELPGSGHSSPVLWGDKIFLTSADSKAAERYVLCLSAADGHVIWRKSFPYPSYHIHDQNSFATSSPAVDANHVYVAWATPQQCSVYAFTHNKGDVAWQHDLGSFNSQHGFASSPIVYKDLVIIGDEQDGPNPEGGGNPDAGFDGKSFLWAMSCANGDERWKTPRKSTIVTYATPCIFQPEGGKPELICDSRSHGMSAIDPATGLVDWEIPLFDRRAVGSPIVVGDLVLGACGVGSGNNTLFAVRPTAGVTKPKEVYKIDKASAPYVPTPVANGKLVFLWNDRGIVTCIDGPSGKIHWREHIGGNFSSSPVRAGDKLFCVFTDGEVIVIAAADKYQLLAKNALNDTCRSTPAIAGGRMYVRTASHLVSVGGK